MQVCQGCRKYGWSEKERKCPCGSNCENRYGILSAAAIKNKEKGNYVFIFYNTTLIKREGWKLNIAGYG